MAANDRPRPSRPDEALALDGVERPLIAHGGDGGQAALQPDHGGADVAALVGEHGHADVPAAVQRAEEAVGRHHDVGEEDLVELRAAGHLAQRPDLDAGQAHVEQEERDAAVLGQRRGRCGP